MTTALSAGLAMTTALSAGLAQAGDDGVYDLGQIHVTAPREGALAFTSFGGTTVSRKTLEAHRKDSLDAAVALVPGVSSALTGNQRNESNIYIHGFDRWSIPLSVDGVPIYLPADNRLDFSRFLTDDVAQVQIAKGYASVLDGPGAMGGAINLTSRTPTKPREGEIRTEAHWGNTGQFDGYKTYVRAGMRSERFYFQASGTFKDTKGWELSKDFTPTTLQAAGRRDWSASEDKGVNLKFGFTPNDTDEYSLSFTRSIGQKDAPVNVDPAISSRFWNWPWWNVQTLAANTRTAVGENGYLKTRVYYQTFDNAIDMFDNNSRSTRTTAAAAHSEYSDFALGGSAEFGWDFGAADTLKAALHFRHDDHSEHDQKFSPAYFEPMQHSVMDTYSVAVENIVHATPELDLVQGISYDYRDISRAEDYVYPTGIFSYKPSSSHAVNGQIAAIWHYSDTAEVFANISDRTRFPTLFELYSTRFGGAASNPDLQPERAINTQIGWKSAYAEDSQLSVMAYYADLTNVIQSVDIGGSVVQNQNVGDGYRYGLDLSFDHRFSDKLALGGSLSLLHTKVHDPSNPRFHMSGFPDAKVVLYASYQPIDRLTLRPSVEYSDGNWTAPTISGVTSYFQTDSYTRYRRKLVMPDQAAV